MTDDGATAPPANLEEWLAGLHPEPAPAADGFCVDSDELATWAFRKRASHQRELDRLRSAAADERAKIDAWEHDVTAGPAARVAFFDGALDGYYRSLHAADPDLARSYRVPGGTLGRRKNPDSLEVAGEAEAVAWLMDNCPELVAHRVDKAAAKKALQVPGVGDAQPGDRLPVVELSTGEVVPGMVHVVGVERVFVKAEG